MAIYQLFAVYDKKVGAFNTPLSFRSKGEAMRSFMDAVQDGKQTFARHPEDYVFMHLGSFDDETGVLDAMSTPHPVMSALDCVKANPPVADLSEATAERVSALRRSLE